jgi:rubrerythrin
MAWTFGLGRININGKLKKEVERTDKDIGELFKEFIQPEVHILNSTNLERATNLIKRILGDIEQHKKLLSHDYNLHNFPEINQLENSIKNFYKMLEEDHKLIKSQQRIKLDPIIKNIKTELLTIRHSWDIYKDKLHRLGIIK